MNDTPAERAEKAATRRRWITLAEAVAVAGLVIAGLTLWMSWSDRRADEQAKTEAATIYSREKTRVDLRAEVAGDGRRLVLSDAGHQLQDVTVTFPRALGVASQTPAGDPVIDAAWFRAALLKATDGGPDKTEGRLPVLVATSVIDGDAPRTLTDSYDVVWKTDGGWPFGRSLKLVGLRLRARGGSQATIDAAWTQRLKTFRSAPR